MELIIKYLHTKKKMNLYSNKSGILGDNTGKMIAKRNTFSKGETMPYDEAILMGNLVKLGHDDIGQTLTKIGNGTGKENNPVVAPIVNNVSPDTFRALGMLANVALADRWKKSNNPSQNKTEMTIANLIEAAALKMSGEPFTMRYGVQI